MKPNSLNQAKELYAEAHVSEIPVWSDYKLPLETWSEERFDIIRAEINRASQESDRALLAHFEPEAQLILIQSKLIDQITKL